MPETIFYDPDRPKTSNYRIDKSEALKFTVDGDLFATKEGTSLSSAAWTAKSGSITIGSDTEADNASTALVTISQEGESLVEVKLTFADGQIGVVWIRITTPPVDRAITRY